MDCENGKKMGHKWKVDMFTLCGIGVVTIDYSMSWAYLTVYMVKNDNAGMGLKSCMIEL